MAEIKQGPLRRAFSIGAEMKRKLTLEEVALYKLRRYKCDYKRLMTEPIGAAERHGKRQPAVHKLHRKDEPA